MRISDMMTPLDIPTPFVRTFIPAYVLKLAAKRRGVCCHWNSIGTAKRQKNYFMQEAG